MPHRPPRVPGRPRIRRLARGAAVTAAALTMLAASALPAGAHVQVLATGVERGDADARVSFHASSESSSGAASVRVRLPAGIAPPDVSWVSGPDGWRLRTTEDGFAVAGPALTPGAPVRYTVAIRQLPDVRRLAFPTIVTYADGSTDAWDQPVTGGAEPERPAPVLTLPSRGDARTVVVPALALLVVVAGIAAAATAVRRRGRISAPPADADAVAAAPRPHRR